MLRRDIYAQGLRDVIAPATGEYASHMPELLSLMGSFLPRLSLSCMHDGNCITTADVYLRTSSRTRTWRTRPLNANCPMLSQIAGGSASNPALVGAAGSCTMASQQSWQCETDSLLFAGRIEPSMICTRLTRLGSDKNAVGIDQLQWSKSPDFFG